jgi:hypothetical protein
MRRSGDGLEGADCEIDLGGLWVGFNTERTEFTEEGNEGVASIPTPGVYREV